MKKGNKEMWYNYCGEPAGETEEEAKQFAKNEMSNHDILNYLVDAFGDMKYLFWCMRQREFLEEFSEDIEKAIEIYFEDNFEERNEEE
jgi:predicted RNase H-like HicB family nuclease